MQSLLPVVNLLNFYSMLYMDLCYTTTMEGIWSIFRLYGLVAICITCVVSTCLTILILHGLLFQITHYVHACFSLFHICLTFSYVIFSEILSFVLIFSTLLSKDFSIFFSYSTFSNNFFFLKKASFFLNFFIKEYLNIFFGLFFSFQFNFIFISFIRSFSSFSLKRNSTLLYNAIRLFFSIYVNMDLLKFIIRFYTIYTFYFAVKTQFLFFFLSILRSLTAFSFIYFFLALWTTNIKEKRTPRFVWSMLNKVVINYSYRSLS